MQKLIAIASDHAGYELKEILKDYIKSLGFEIADLGTSNKEESVDYPDYGYKTANFIAENKAQFGVIICGTGIGISIAANRNKKIRAALCFNEFMARMARQHNDANILALGARVINEETAKECVKAFLENEFEGGRHLKRMEKL